MKNRTRIAVAFVAWIFLHSVADAQPMPSEPPAVEESQPAADAAADDPSQPDGADEKAAETGGDEAPGADISPADQATGLFVSIKGGQWLLALGFLLMIVGSVARWALSRGWDFWETKAGGYTIAASLGLATLGAGIVTEGFSFELLATAAAAALSAMALHGPAKAAKNKIRS